MSRLASGELQYGTTQVTGSLGTIDVVLMVHLVNEHEQAQVNEHKVAQMNECKQTSSITQTQTISSEGTLTVEISFRSALLDEFPSRRLYYISLSHGPGSMRHVNTDFHTSCIDRECAEQVSTIVCVTCLPMFASMCEGSPTPDK